MMTGGFSRGPMSSTHARSSSPDSRPSLSNTAPASSPASMVTSRAVIGARQRLQLGGHAVDEGVDVLGEHPGTPGIVRGHLPTATTALLGTVTVP